MKRLIFLNCVPIDLSTWYHVIILTSFLLVCIFVSVLVVFGVSLLLRDKQEAKFGGVMSV